MSLRRETFTISEDTELSYLTNLTDPSARVLLFLHFWGGSSKTYSRVLDLLLSAHDSSPLYSTSSESFHYYNYSIARLASDVEALLQHLRLRDVALVGHSMGAKVAQLVAGRSCFENSHDRRRRMITKGLVLLAPAPAGPLELPGAMRRQQIHAYETRGRRSSWRGMCSFLLRLVGKPRRKSLGQTKTRTRILLASMWRRW
ncbi:alpha/beta-hydrolase [Apiospora rasikravindrae]|uniref:Alpha/beta-hydrolase n=1 Tax=Apiospora rasikravindrae TaxID=990691 RepID=A0ABR1U121_9PEZI